MKNPTVDTIPRVVHTINNSICLCDVMDIFFINKLFYSEIDSGLIGRIVGNRTVSRRLLCPVKRVMRRSIPNPEPVIGGNPCSIALRNTSSTSIASSSHPALALDCTSKSSRCTIGSMSSPYEFTTSQPLITS